MANQEFIRNLRKAEFDLFVDGIIDTKLAWELAKRNNIALPYDSLEELEADYNSATFKDKLNINHNYIDVVTCENDIYEVVVCYLKKALSKGVKWVEINIDPTEFQKHNLDLAVIMDGVATAILDYSFMIPAGIVIIANTENSVETAIKLVNDTKPWHRKIVGFALAGDNLAKSIDDFSDYFNLVKSLNFSCSCYIN